MMPVVEEKMEVEQKNYKPAKMDVEEKEEKKGFFANLFGASEKKKSKPAPMKKSQMMKM